MLDRLMQRLARRGYGWYLALKVGKALLAVPLFVLYVPALIALVLLLAAFRACAELWEGPKAIAADAMSFWQRKWFKGFTRAYYDNLSHYRRLTPEVEER